MEQLPCTLVQVPAHTNVNVGKKVEDPGYYRLPGYADSVGRINLRAILEARQVRGRQSQDARMDQHANWQ